MKKRPPPIILGEDIVHARMKIRDNVSWTSLFLCRTGNHRIMLYDHDDFSEENLAGQFVRNNMVGTNKAQAIKKLCGEFTGNQWNLEAISNRYTQESAVAKIMFSCFDNMAARKLMFSKWKGQFQGEIPFKYQYLYIDARLVAEAYQVYYVTPELVDRYEATLFDDNAIPTESCTFKSTSHFAAMASAKMIQGFTAFLANRKENDDIYELPFSYKEDGVTFNIEIDYA